MTVQQEAIRDGEPRCPGAVWRDFAVVGAVGLAFFVYSLSVFRRAIAVTK
jgi:hypothetical protein